MLRDGQGIISDQFIKLKVLDIVGIMCAYDVIWLSVAMWSLVMLKIIGLILSGYQYMTMYNLL